MKLLIQISLLLCTVVLISCECEDQNGNCTQFIGTYIGNSRVLHNGEEIEMNYHISLGDGIYQLSNTKSVTFPLAQDNCDLTYSILEGGPIGNEGRLIFNDNGVIYRDTTVGGFAGGLVREFIGTRQ